MVALSPQFQLDITPAFHQAKESLPLSLQSSTVDTDSPNLGLRHHPRMRADAKCNGRSDTSHGRRDQGAKDVPRRGGGGGSHN